MQVNIQQIVVGLIIIGVALLLLTFLPELIFLAIILGIGYVIYRFVLNHS